MARLKPPQGGVRKALTLSEQLYGFFLYAYPAPFRRAYGLRMARVFRDSCRAAVERHGVASLIPFWLQTLSDLVGSACLERWYLFKKGICSMTNRQNVPLRLWGALAATGIAFAVSLVASLNLYLLEDASPLTQAAYSASPLLRFSYDGVYLSALAAGVAMCALIGYSIIRRTALVVIGLTMVTFFVAFGGFGGLLFRHPVTFLLFFLAFLALTLLSLLLGRGVATHTARFLEQQPAATLGACVSVGSALLLNVIALVLHTLLLNPVSHALYMQGQIGGTHFNFSLLAMAVAFLTLLACIISLGFALRLPSPSA